MNEMNAWILDDELAAYVRDRGSILTVDLFDVLIG